MKKKNRTFQLTSKKKVRLRYFGPFIANSRIPPKRIAIDEYFDEFNNNEQKAVIWHELYHRKNTTGLKRIWWALRSIFTKENILWTEEFLADEYSAKKGGKENELKNLYKCKELYDKKIVEYNPKTHPPIDERIRRIKEVEKPKK